MKVQVRLSIALSAIALLVALSGVAGALAGSVLVTSKEIKNGTILTQDIHKGGVQSSDVKNGAVASADVGEGQIHTGDIGTNQVTPSDVEAPAPAQLTEGDVAKGEATTEGFSLIDTAGTYAKEDPTSILEVDWTGSAGAGGEGACVFQLRVDGQPAPSGAGQVYLGPAEVSSVSASALFELPAGPHTVEVWAQVGSNHNPSGGPFFCTVGPAAAGIGQTFVVAEQIN